MDIGSIFLILALMVLVILIVTRPFFEHKTVLVSQEEHDHSSLLAEQDRILDALTEIDFDYSMGKIPEEEYPLQRGILLRKGSEVLRQLEQYQGRQASQTTRKTHDRLEAWVAEGAPAAGTPQAASSTRQDDPEDELEVLIASRRRSRQEKSAGFCPKCGVPLQKSDLFCPKCGERLKQS
jgi:hypothetical protein